MKTVAIIEGFAGGPMHTRQFRKALSDAGFKVIKDRRQADIIIAHSAGIYAVPFGAKAKLVLLIGPTYWPGRSLMYHSKMHRRGSKRYHVTKFGWRFYIWKKLLELLYFFTRHHYLWYGVKNNNRLDRINKLAQQPSRKIIVVRNHDDPFTTPEIKQELKNNQIQFVELPGIHDDFTTNPQPYVDLVKKES